MAFSPQCHWYDHNWTLEDELILYNPASYNKGVDGGDGNEVYMVPLKPSIAERMMGWAIVVKIPLVFTFLSKT